ncbi:galactosyltransferase-related protein [Mariniflexile soesokkakense]|uniref:Galactosyltransferase-related protein n=1 Tax=Mariniflexile soesokkakense TaxID=1343160 RepID=A0ABV0AAF7_9FLAO
MITIVLTYRNRDIGILKNCLDSLLNQTDRCFEVILIDYGSVALYKNELEKLLGNYKFIKLVRCETEQQLWCKSRAINIALKRCVTPFVFVGDVDMIYSPDFISTLNILKNNLKVVYFQVGFLSQTESKINKAFVDYHINFKSNKEATGMALFTTDILKSINGYDEFYNGWGGEDTDVHIRLRNAGYTVYFYDDTILMLHQWHPKSYRNKNSLTPFHNLLEKINHEYLKFTNSNNKIKANVNFPWGSYNKSDYDDLNNIETTYSLTNKEAEFKAFVNHILLTEKDKVIKIEIKPHKEFKSIKQNTKKVLGQKTISFLEMDTINNLLLEYIITNLRDKAYQFQYNSKNQTIHLIIKL